MVLINSERGAWVCFIVYTKSDTSTRGSSLKKMAKGNANGDWLCHFSQQRRVSILWNFSMANIHLRRQLPQQIKHAQQKAKLLEDENAQVEVNLIRSDPILSVYITSA